MHSVIRKINGKDVSITGVAKGAGMISPNMATMLSYVMTDAAISSKMLAHALKVATDVSFNSITVDGDMSTNDTVIALASGASGADIVEGEIIGEECEIVAGNIRVRSFVGESESVPYTVSPWRCLVNAICEVEVFVPAATTAVLARAAILAPIPRGTAKVLPVPALLPARRPPATRAVAPTAIAGTFAEELTAPGLGNKTVCTRVFPAAVPSVTP